MYYNFSQMKAIALQNELNNYLFNESDYSLFENNIANSLLEDKKGKSPNFFTKVGSGVKSGFQKAGAGIKSGFGKAGQAVSKLSDKTKQALMLGALGVGVLGTGIGGGTAINNINADTYARALSQMEDRPAVVRSIKKTGYAPADWEMDKNIPFEYTSKEQKQAMRKAYRTPNTEDDLEYVRTYHPKLAKAYTKFEKKNSKKR